mmetsp:Transcript_9488/g.11024  ORF Transcript_9488/g.11024 Transcript_9488/m.11024 type:complete len:106 (+) Transcript_9488:39-356(+)
MVSKWAITIMLLSLIIGSSIVVVIGNDMIITTIPTASVLVSAIVSIIVSIIPNAPPVFILVNADVRSSLLRHYYSYYVTGVCVDESNRIHQISLLHSRVDRRRRP